MTDEEEGRLRRYIAEHVIGDSPPPLPVAAQNLIRSMLRAQKVSRDTSGSTQARE